VERHQLGRGQPPVRGCEVANAPRTKRGRVVKTRPLSTSVRFV
jgi:hypothetical protein